MTDFAKTLAEALPQDRAAVDGKALKGRMDIAVWNDEYLVGLFVNAVGKFY